ncbi:phosphotransferase family protein [Sphingomonas nostoxanthinifaciens]|uniref:phosphotransferase family protein n=1 Tax=Sphingomonas nostoxanthinifaciens TaxID=2872652 RepID=UPI001CC205AB|nr:aminoglycoside phosphotransferase family protein [Sphingomonas nostoxanthinifaciens]UAK25630.1 aminoglycoside phosphotransferase family protein [Sphingomonas nostoxanthinifaciens]
MLLAKSEGVFERLACVDQLAALVGQVFPLISLDDRRLERSGGDHDLLIVDESFAFRFPRSGVHGLALEIDVLRHLRRRSAVATPTYSHVDPAGRFGGYPLISGSALTPACFAVLPEDRRDGVLRAAAVFLSALHGLSPEVIAPVRQWPSMWTPAEFAHRGLTEFVPAIAEDLPDQARAAGAFYARYRELELPPPVVVHGDLVYEHVLIDKDTLELTGIIDFGDIALGDPAQDFLGFWAYGVDAAARAIDLYDPGGPDAGLIERSRHHFIRYCLDRLLENVDRGPSARHDLAAGIDELLATDTFHNPRR